MNTVKSEKTFEERLAIVDKMMNELDGLKLDQIVELGIRLDAFDLMIDGIREQLCAFADAGDLDGIKTAKDARESLKSFLDD